MEIKLSAQNTWSDLIIDFYWLKGRLLLRIFFAAMFPKALMSTCCKFSAISPFFFSPAISQSCPMFEIYAILWEIENSTKSRKPCSPFTDFTLNNFREKSERPLNNYLELFRVHHRLLERGKTPPHLWQNLSSYFLGAWQNWQSLQAFGKERISLVAFELPKTTNEALGRWKDNKLLEVSGGLELASFSFTVSRILLKVLVSTSMQDRMPASGVLYA